MNRLALQLRMMWPSKALRRLAKGLTIAVVIAFSRAAVEADEPTRPGRHALLVGCTTYDNLPESVHLRGPGNDVLLMRDLLATRFRFPAEAIAVLAESEGPDRRPTRANIEREFLRLTRSAGDGDEVVILMAGHGSQQPDVDPPGAGDVEPDGLDEIFLPADVGKWDGGVGAVHNALADDELRGWLAEIRRRGASVWVIMDACHSGTMTRGSGDEVRRELPADLIVPAEAIEAAAGRAAGRQVASPAERSRGGEPPSPLGAGDEAGLVAMYAAQSNEVTVEKLLPAEGTGRKPYGLLTFTINEVLSRAAEPLSYEELTRRVRDRYVHLGRTFPTPTVEGRDRRREVLGDRELAGRQVRLKKSGPTWRIDAGAVQGMSPGSILSVAGAAEAPAGFVRVTEVRPFEATVVPADRAGRETDPAALADGAACEVVEVDFGDARLPVAADPADHLGRPVDAGQIEAVRADLAEVAGEPRSRIRLVADPADARWLVRRHDGRTYVLPAAGVPGPTSTGGQGDAPSLFGPAPVGRPASAWLRDTFETVARAENLKRIAASVAGGPPRGGKGVKIEIEPRLLSSESDAEGTPLADEGAGLTLYGGDLLTLRVKNPNTFPVDVTLLYVDSGYGIGCLFPVDETNRLRPGESLSIGPMEVNAETTGLEHLVAIAVAVPPGEIRGPADFSILAQPSLEAARDVERTRGGPPAAETPLGDLLESAVFASGTTRGLAVKKVEDHVIRLTSFRVSPVPRPGAPTPE